MSRNRKKQRFDTSNENPSVARQLGIQRKLTVKDMYEIQPMNDNQEKFLDLYKSEVPILVVTGYAGTAKTFLSVRCALVDVLNGQYDRLIVIRSAVETRSQGFLPGTQGEKDQPFEEPYEQVCNSLFKTVKTPYQHLKSFGNIEFKTTGNLRGQTFDNAVILVDEVQNMDFNELSTVIERVGINSRIIIAGDNHQIDLDRKHNQKSGFDEMIKVFNRMNGHYVDFVEYGIDDIVRSGIVKEWLTAKYKS